MSNEFMREERYIVFKLSDVERYLTDKDRANITMMKMEIDAGRDCANKPPFKGLIVEADWPEYEPTWKAIEARVTGAQPAPSVPTESIGKMLAQAMEVAVANGANSVSMPDELVEVAAWLSGVQPNPANGQTRAVRDVIAERRRQIEVEGWAPEHDDRHGAHELAEAAACYCLSSAGKPFDYFETMWPWERRWFKVSDPRRDLVKAGALVLAEIERLDRAAAPKPGASDASTE